MATIWYPKRFTKQKLIWNSVSELNDKIGNQVVPHDLHPKRKQRTKNHNKTTSFSTIFIWMVNKQLWLLIRFHGLLYIIIFVLSFPDINNILQNNNDKLKWWILCALVIIIICYVDDIVHCTTNTPHKEHTFHRISGFIALNSKRKLLLCNFERAFHLWLNVYEEF